MSKIAKVKPYTIENGDGIRVSIFFSGCEHYCKNCFNSELWDFNIGETFSREYYENKIKPLIKDYINGLTILGGEPLHHKNLFATYRLVKWFKNDFPDKTIWLYTGYDFDILNSKYNEYKYTPFAASADEWLTRWEIISNVDVLVDGEYIDEQKDLTLKFRGSKNQRVIDVKQSLTQSKMVLYCD